MILSATMLLVSCGSRGSSSTQSDSIDPAISAKWDNSLENLNTLLGEYMELAKKVTTGDLSAIAKLLDGELMQKITDAMSQLEIARDSKELTATQLKKLKEIVDKYEKMAD